MLMILQCIFLIFFSTILDVRHFHIRLKIRDASRIREGIFVSMIAGREEKKKIRKLPPSMSIWEALNRERRGVSR